MRVLLATDGSPSAEHATSLVSSVAWPAGSAVHVVIAFDERPDMIGAPFLLTDDHYGRLRADAEQAHEETLRRAIARLDRPGLDVDGEVLDGRPATVIVHAASSWQADLLVIGHRGLGPWRSMLLGSVSAEVVDHAPCPVLVARGDHLGEAILADDGSDCARAASDFLATHAELAPQAVEVLSVADVAYPMTAVLATPVGAGAVGDWEASAETIRGAAGEAAGAAAERLEAAGLIASSASREGDPAHEIVHAAREHASDLIVLGSHGRTGLARLLLGSVARNVLLEAPCSVLIVRRPQHA
ncbi:MAG TPA: universal stress protein [Candidatus Dormibacteraeota bacterium]|nr:universal stress protein [Candidatus Dormibacteraeota bacterium]